MDFKKSKPKKGGLAISMYLLSYLKKSATYNSGNPSQSIYKYFDLTNSNFLSYILK